MLQKRTYGFVVSRHSCSQASRDVLLWRTSCVECLTLTLTHSPFTHSLSHPVQFVFLLYMLIDIVCHFIVLLHITIIFNYFVYCFKLAFSIQLGWRASAREGPPVKEKRERFAWSDFDLPPRSEARFFFKATQTSDNQEIR